MTHKGNIIGILLYSTWKLLCTLAAPRADVASAESYVVKWVVNGVQSARFTEGFKIAGALSCPGKKKTVSP